MTKLPNKPQKMLRGSIRISMSHRRVYFVAGKRRFVSCVQSDLCVILLRRWSDIYYIPKHFFHDFINLGNVFHAVDSFHEVAIPTMIHIIDLTYQLTPFHSVITRLGDCWGNCCKNGSTPADIQWERCGHRIDLSDENLKRTLVKILDASAQYLNTPINARFQNCT